MLSVSSGGCEQSTTFPTTSASCITSLSIFDGMGTLLVAFTEMKYGCEFTTVSIGIDVTTGIAIALIIRQQERAITEKQSP